MHCSEQNGDATCVANEPGRPYCSLCVAVDDHQGCIGTVPAPACSPSGSGPTTAGTGGDTTSTTGTTGASTTTDTGLDSTSTSTTGPAACEGDEGEIDAACQEADATKPYCVGGTCSSCTDAGSHDFCGGADPKLPACDDATGLCVACGDVDGFCAGETPVCDADGSCVACSAHAECPDTACHLHPDDPLVGSCFDPSEVVWVDNDNVCPGMGTEASPACSLATAVGAVQTGENAVFKLSGAGSSYDELVTADGDITVAILGSSTPDLSGDPAGGSSMVVDDAIVYVHTVRFSDNADEHGLACASGVVLLEESEARGNAEYGLHTAGPCQLEVRRSTVHHNTAGGIRQFGGKLTLVNSAVGVNGDGASGPGINAQLSEIEVVYSTIAGNDAGTSDNIHCLDATGSVRNSIVVGTSAPSIDLDCFTLSYDHSAVDTMNFGAGTNTLVGAYDAAWFANPTSGNFQLTTAGQGVFADIAMWMQGDPETDADGTPRPMGMPGFPGLDEP